VLRKLTHTLPPPQIVSYITKDRFKQNRKKTFKGHNTAGYACQVGFSPDAKYVVSGASIGGAVAPLVQPLSVLLEPIWDACTTPDAPALCCLGAFSCPRAGDSEGRAFFWEWSSPYKVARTIKAHDGVCIGATWHPLETSKVATCGWDGLIKYWD
jgi:pre-mRNA-processing factor 17